MSQSNGLVYVLIFIMSIPALGSILCCIGWLGLGFIGLVLEGTR